MVATNGSCNGNRNGSTCADKAATLTVCGDAAHAIPQFLAQGTNPAIQGVCCLANVIRQYNVQYDEQANGRNRLEDILQIEYKDKRWSTITSTKDITVKAGLLGYLEASSGSLAKFRDLSSTSWTRRELRRRSFWMLPLRGYENVWSGVKSRCGTDVMRIGSVDGFRLVLMDQPCSYDPDIPHFSPNTTRRHNHNHK